MNFTDLSNDKFIGNEDEKIIESYQTKAIPKAHPAESDLFVRHEGILGHNQTTLTNARITLIGAGGLNSSVAQALARSGAGSLTIIDDDYVDRTNLSRQLFFQDDLGYLKGVRLARNVMNHAVGGATITGIGLRFEQALETFALPADIFVVGVDNNACRLQAVQEARRRRIPAVFTMLSLDGMRCQCFLQGPSSTDPCLWCALPNLDPEKIMPCASAIISTCMLAAGFTTFFIYRALMGWPEGVRPFNWREMDLLGVAPSNQGLTKRRPSCPMCSKL